MADLIRGLDVGRVRTNLEQVRAEIAAAAQRAGRSPDDVQIVAAGKYVALEELGVLADAGISVIGENRAQDVEAKVAAYGDLFAWDFIGHLQSRKVKQLLAHVRLIHSVGSDSVLRELGRHAGGRDDMEVLVEVNIAGDPGKSGIAADELAAFIARCPVRVSGLMTMPPLATDPQASRPHFAALAGLAAEHGLRRLSMGTTQDYAVAVEEGATLVRIGTRLYT